MFKKAISITLSIFIFTGGILMLTACKEEKTVFSLQFTTTPLNTDSQVNSFPYEIEWDDTVLNTKPSQFSPTLAKTAIVLASNAYSYTYALDNLEKMGFEHFAKFNYADNYDQDAVGAIIASKEFSNTTLLCIILRGTYAKEWYSNFDIGNDVNSTYVHKGFNNASKFVQKKLDMYIANYGIEKEHTKFLVTGHSRGAAVANLCAKDLIDIYGADNVYAYTFATPNTTTDKSAADSRYSAIFNFVNPEDFIAYVPLKEWGFTKYGTTIYFPKKDSDENYEIKLNEMTTLYEKYAGRKFITYNGTDAQDLFFKKAFELAPTIKDYYDTKYEVAGLKLSVHDYMNVVCALLNDENLISNGLIILSSDNTDFEEFKKFISLGMETDDKAFSLDYQNSLISYAHPAETYLSFLEVYINHQ